MNKIYSYNQSFCRICFSSAPVMHNLLPFLPIIRNVAQTKIPYDDRVDKICNSCANGLIMANIFRVKVIESNSKFRELLESDAAKAEEEVILNEEVESDDDMSVEFLFESSSDDDEKPMEIKFENTPRRMTLTRREVERVKDELKSKIIANAKATTPPNDDVKLACFICTEPGSKDNLLKPFHDTLNRIVDIRNCKVTECLCNYCIKKLEDAKVFFERLDKSDTRKSSNATCQFCLRNVPKSGKIPKNALQVFDELETHGHEIQKNGKACTQCVQALNRIRTLKSCYIAKEKYFEKKNSKQKSPKMSKKEKLSILQKEPWETDSDESIERVHIPRSAKKRLRLRPKSRYVAPKPDEPIDSDYQCHMSDFEEVESDFEVPPVAFRCPLNVPFKHTFIYCPQCKINFVNPYEMEVHINIMHETRGDICDMCNKKFKTEKQVKEHKVAVHATEFSCFNFRRLCEICGLLKRKFNDHYAIHFEDRPFKCSMCTSDYKTKGLLEDHVRVVHMEVKRHRCQYCDKLFGYAADKMRHEIGVHTKAFKHVCHFCGKCFLKKNMMTNHQRSQHPEAFLDEN